MSIKILIKYTLICFLCLFVTNIYSQKAYKIIYGVEPLNTLKKGKAYDPTVKAILVGSAEYAKKNKFILITDNISSYFREKERLEVDFDDKRNLIYSKLSSGITKFNQNVFTDFKNNSLIFTRNLIGNHYVVKKDEFYDFNWDIKKETKIIAGLEAQKAVGTYYDIFFEMNREIIVWFIPSIPIPAGPDIYFGLPGLVAEVHLRKAIVRIESIEKIDEVVRQPTFKEVMSYEDYLDFVTKANAKIKKEYN